MYTLSREQIGNLIKEKRETRGASFRQIDKYVGITKNEMMAIERGDMLDILWDSTDVSKMKFYTLVGFLVFNQAEISLLRNSLLKVLNPPTSGKSEDLPDFETK